MTKRLFSLFALLSLFSFSALAKDPVETGTFNNKAIYGFDPVAYFTMNKPVEGSEDYTYSWRGADWFFSSKEHMDLFVSAPEKYAPQYGGHCSYAMSSGRFVGIDEEAFTIYNGKLYLNYSKSVREDWLKDKDEFIRKADKNYAEKADLSGY